MFTDDEPLMMISTLEVSGLFGQPIKIITYFLSIYDKHTNYIPTIN